MSFIRKSKRGGQVSLAAVENKGSAGQGVQKPHKRLGLSRVVPLTSRRKPLCSPFVPSSSNPSVYNQRRIQVISIRTSPLYVLDVERDPVGALETLREEARQAMQEDDAEAILLGCAGFAKFAEELEEELGIPVLDGVVCAVKMAEGIVELGKKTSKAKTYRPPETKSFTGMFARFGSRSPELQKKVG